MVDLEVCGCRALLALIAVTGFGRIAAGRPYAPADRLLAGFRAVALIRAFLLEVMAAIRASDRHAQPLIKCINYANYITDNTECQANYGLIWRVGGWIFGIKGRLRYPAHDGRS